MRKGTLAVALLGVVAGLLVIWQLVSGMMMYWASGAAALKTAHRHGGLTTATICLLYIALSVVLILHFPSGPRGGGE